MSAYRSQFRIPGKCPASRLAASLTSPPGRIRLGLSSSRSFSRTAHGLVACLALFVGEALAQPNASTESSSQDFGPLYAQYSLTLDSGTRTEALGPLFYNLEQPDAATFALPPLFSKT